MIQASEWKVLRELNPKQCCNKTQRSTTIDVDGDRRRIAEGRKENRKERWGLEAFNSADKVR